MTAKPNSKYLDVLERLQRRQATFTTLVVGLAMFGASGDLIEYLLLEVMALMGFPASFGVGAVQDLVQGIQILSFILAIAAVKFTHKLFTKEPLLFSIKPELVKPQERLSDSFFKGFYSIALWVALLVFLGVVECNLGNLFFSTTVASFIGNLLRFLFFAGVFWVWSIYFGVFRNWYRIAFSRLGLSQFSNFGLCLIVDALMILKVLGFHLETFSGFPWDLVLLLLAAILTATLVFSRNLKWGVSSSSLFTWIYVLGGPLAKFDQVSILTLFPGPMVESVASDEWLSVFSTFGQREFLLTLVLFIVFLPLSFTNNRAAKIQSNAEILTQT
jgi:hypothetical protein